MLNSRMHFYFFTCIYIYLLRLDLVVAAILANKEVCPEDVQGCGYLGVNPHQNF